MSDSNEHLISFSAWLMNDAFPNFPRAACMGKDPEMWVQKNKGNNQARKICRGSKREGTPPCPHLDECTAWAKGTVGTASQMRGVILGWYEAPFVKGSCRTDRVYPIGLCQECETPFSKISNKRKFCSPECQQIHLLRRVSKA